MDLGEIGWGGGGVYSSGSGWGLEVGCCECRDEPSGSGATESVLVCWVHTVNTGLQKFKLST
jgi:hypothetical protein